MRRRSFLLAAATAPGFAVAGSRIALAQVEAGDGPYGPLASSPDANGILLPDGFSSRVLATSGETVAGTGYVWPVFPDGGVVFPGDNGGWIYVSNSEAGEGTSGVSALVFDASGSVVDAYSIATGTTRNCAGGPTPWGTWLSGEEYESGVIVECDPTGAAEAIRHPAMGVFIHEAACVDPEREVVYLTEDAPDGRFYRFTPDNYPDLSAGLLEAAQIDDAGNVTWLTVPDPIATANKTRLQVPESTVFNGGEGIWYRDGIVWFVTKGDGGVWKLDAAAQTIEAVYKAAEGEVVLNGPDNIVLSEFGDVFVCEDFGEDQQVVLITPDGVIAPVLQLTGQSGSELAGAAFDSSGTRMYVSSQRGGTGGGITYEITGPFRQPVAPTTTSATTVSETTKAIAATTAAGGSASDDGDDGAPIVPIGIGAALVAALGFGAYRLRTRPVSRPPLE